ncbi:Ig-like domain-containing protein [Acrocarpospora sp. B8E8]|uniref:Ig-like domain-containing protein n=1 Tax=Acrocarpospora sp. B8E8 TaxID=3153572 RepID=UPI00325F4138
MKRALMLIPAATLAAMATVASTTAAAAGPVDGPIAVNLPPRVSLTSPADGFVGVLGCPVTFAAVAEDIDNQILLGRPATPDDVPVIADDGIDRVEFYLNGHLLAADYTAPYEVTVDRGPFVPRTRGRTRPSRGRTTTTSRS